MICPRTRRDVRVPVAFAAGLALALGCAPAAPAAQSRDGCAKLRQNQALNVPVSWRYREEFSRVDNGRLQVRRVKDVRRAFGRLAIRGATCKRSDGRWIVINPIGLGYGSFGMDAVGNIRSSGLMKGWGLGVRNGAGGSSPRVALQIMHCGQENFFKTLKVIASVPVPWMAVGSALWIAGRFLPKDKVRCGNVGVKRLVVYATRDGELRLGDLTAADCCSEIAHFPSRNGGWNLTKIYSIGPITARAA